jgi:sulfatase modifying factor 1
MKKKTSYLISLAVFMGICLLLIYSCHKKDDPKDSVPNIAMVTIPAGTFTMGSTSGEVSRDPDETQYTVTLSAFRMSKYEITNEQFASFLNSKSIGIDGLYKAGSFPTQPLVYASSGNIDWGLHFTGGKWVPVAGFENHPAIFLTWYGATEFATFVGGHLPTEAQWEYACRAGTTTPFNTGTCLSNTQANYNWSSPYNTCTNTITTPPNATQAVGSYPANTYGLYDMHGNDWEWCSDWYGVYPATAQTNPTGALTGTSKVIRGGSCIYYAKYCRSADRNSSSPDSYSGFVGIRVVMAP